MIGDKIRKRNLLPLSSQPRVPRPNLFPKAFRKSTFANMSRNTDARIDTTSQGTIMYTSSIRMSGSV